MIRSLNHFEAVIGYSRKDIQWLIKNPDILRYSYRVDKSNNRQREISPSLGDLKDIQNRLNDRVFSNVVFPYYVVGSTKRRSGVLNAKLHSGLLYHFKTDLLSFFDYVTFRQVNYSLLSLGFSGQIAEIITKLVTYKGHLPMGASTSAFIANLVGLQMDYKILEVCRDLGIMYTRYVDDLLFSANHCFQDNTSQFLEILKQCGFRLNNDKTFYKLGDIEVTGAITGCNGIKPTVATLEKYHNTSSLEVMAGCEGYLRYITKINGMSISEYKRKYSTLRYPEKIILSPKPSPSMKYTC